MGATYGEYLKIPELLSLQQLKSEDREHDETLFIIIHQVYELWFKQILHELDRLGDQIDADAIGPGSHQLVRVLKILKTMVSQLDILETMTPLEFLSFRAFLGSSSGFQSAQFRELEYLLGHKDPVHLERFRGTDEEDHLGSRMNTPSIWARFVRLLDRAGHPIDHHELDRPVTTPTAPSASVQAALIEVYRTDRPLAEFCELLTDLDEGLQEWRYRHMMMVQRTIGTKQGTGGSDGAGYLRTTLFRPVFPDLWEIRSAL
jgi:tryptophan 2,3-dioxygenase